MKTLLEIQVRADVPDGLGGVTTTWSTLQAAWVEMWAVKGEERAASASTLAAVSHRVRMHAYPGLTTAHRFKLGTRTFNITFVNDVEQRGAEYVVDCMEIVGRDAQ